MCYLASSHDGHSLGVCKCVAYAVAAPKLLNYALKPPWHADALMRVAVHPQKLCNPLWSTIDTSSTAHCARSYAATMAKGQLSWPRYVAWSPVIFALLVAGVPTLYTFTQLSPRQRAVPVFSAELWQPKVAVSVSTIAFMIPSWIAAVGQLAASEFWLMNAHIPRRQQAANFVQGLVFLFAAFAYSVLLQQTSAFLVRPAASPLACAHSQPPETSASRAWSYNKGIRSETSDCRSLAFSQHASRACVSGLQMGVGDTLSTQWQRPKRHLSVLQRLSQRPPLPASSVELSVATALSPPVLNGCQPRHWRG